MTTMTEQDARYMRLALETARRAPGIGEVPIAAVVVLGDEVLAEAHNYREVWQDPTAHAELVAIRQAASRLGTWRLTGTTLYVTVEPCAMCAGAIIQSRITRLVFGAYDAKAGACGSVFNLPEERRLNHRVTVIGGLMEAESQALMQSFFRCLRADQLIANR
jgi:tRNA(adenine34) deaminase